MENTQYILLNRLEYQKRILKCITSEEIDKYFNCTVFHDKPDCKQAMIHGMCIASMLATDIDSFVIDEHHTLKIYKNRELENESDIL